MKGKSLELSFLQYLREAQIHNPVFRNLSRPLTLDEFRKEYQGYLAKGRHADEQVAYDILFKELSRGLVMKRDQNPDEARQPLGETTIVNDPRLQMEVTLSFIDPSVDEITRKIADLTGVPLRSEKSIRTSSPFAKSVNYNNMRAWVILQSISQEPRINGKWDSEANGYKLTLGEDLSKDAGEFQSESSLMWGDSVIWAGGLMALSGGIFVFLYFRVRKLRIE
jgi:hypothetical protein